MSNNVNNIKLINPLYDDSNRFTKDILPLTIQEVSDIRNINGECKVCTTYKARDLGIKKRVRFSDSIIDPNPELTSKKDSDLNNNTRTKIEENFNNNYNNNYNYVILGIIILLLFILYVKNK
jgi:hypothetical protein